MDEYSRRQLFALTAAALAAPLVTVCASVSWHWVLLAAGAAGGVLWFLVSYARRLPARDGYGLLLCRAWGGGGRVLLGLTWLWLILCCSLTANMAVTAFPQDRGFPLIPLTLLLLAALPAAKGVGAACRFGGTLFLAVAALLAGVLVFGAADVQLRNLMPAGGAADAAGPLAVLLLPAAGLFLRDGLARRPASWLRWYLLAAGLAVAVSVVCAGFLGLPLAKASANAFWYMSSSLSILGVMERFEAFISSLLAISFCCMVAFLLSAAQKALRAAVDKLPEAGAVWLSAGLAAGGLWLVGALPSWVWPAGNLIFWGVLPAATLAIVRAKKIREV